MLKRFLNTILLLAFAGLLIFSAVSVLPNIVSVSNTVGGKELPIYCVETEKPQISISFDAAWGNEDTQTILDILAKHNVKATFFMTGGWVESYPEDVKKIFPDAEKNPAGKVATYGQVAAMAGNPKMSRAVGNALHKNPGPQRRIYRASVW